MDREVKYVAIQPMTDSEAKFAFKDLIPEEVERFIITHQMEIEHKAMKAKSYDELRHLQGKKEGLDLFWKEISKHAQGKRKEVDKKANSDVKELREKERARGGLIINKKP